MPSPDTNNPQPDNAPADSSVPSPNYSFPKASFGSLSLNETLSALFQQYWKVFSRPGATTFVEELPKASWNSVLTQLLLMSVIETGIIFIDQLLNIQTILRQLLFIQSFALPMILGFNLVCFFLWTGLTYAIGRIFNGESTYKEYCYSYTLLFVPVSIIGSLLSFVPGIGEQLSAIPFIYSFVLHVLMIMGIQKLSVSKSIVTVLLSSFTLIVLTILLAVAFIHNYTY